MACECGHLFYDHHRHPYSEFPCSLPDCSCTDYADVLSDDETAAEIISLLRHSAQLELPFDDLLAGK